MGYRFTLVAAIFLVFAGSLLAQRQIDYPTKPEYTPRWECGRIVSMAPSITETLFALGLGDKVVGVSRFCSYPPEVEMIKEDGGCVGSHLDPNLEAIVRLKPDLLIMLEEQIRATPQIEALRVETLVVSHQTVDGIINSFREIGLRCGAAERGRKLYDDYRRRIDDIRRQTANLPHPKVLFVVDRVLGQGRIADIYVAADDRYFDTIIRLAGGENACSRPGFRYPIVSVEGVMKLNPDIIIDLMPAREVKEHGREAILKDWTEHLANVAAVKNDRVVIMDQDYAYVPGPRFILLVEELARLLHPKGMGDEGRGNGK